MLRLEPLAVRYARALIELGSESKSLDFLEEELAALRDLLEKEAGFRVFLENPGIDRAKKHDLLERVFRGRLSDTLVDFLQIVVRRGRTLFLGHMVRAFHELYREARGEVEVSLTTATRVGEELLDRTRALIQEQLEREVVLFHREDPRILGGLVVRYDDQVLDGSLRNRLQGMRKDMLATRLGSELIHED